MAAASRTVVYVSVSGENRLALYDLDRASGQLSFRKSIEVDGSPGSIAVDPTKKFAYVALRSTGSVATFAINSEDGNLKLLGTAPVVANPVYLATDRKGKFLLTAYYGEGKAAIYPIKADGTVSADAAAIVTTEKNPHSIMASPDNKSVYVPNTGSDLILQYQFDEKTGQLHPHDPDRVNVQAGAGPRHFFFHPTRPFVYFVNEKDSSLTAFTYDAAGKLHNLQTYSTLPVDADPVALKNTCADIEIDSRGRFLYASNRGHDSLACFTIDEATGMLNSAGHAPTEKTPREFNVEPAGEFVFSAGQGSGRMASYRINQETGQLDALKVDEVGKSPAWVLTLVF